MIKPPAKLLTQTAYANLRGIKQPSVNKLVKKGIIRLVNGRIDPDQADRGILESQDPSRDEFRTMKNLGRPATQEPSENSVTAARANQIKVTTALKQFILKEKIGTLVLASVEKVKGFELAQQIKDHLLNIIDRTSPLLSAEADENKIRLMLATEFDELCEVLADGFK